MLLQNNRVACQPEIEDDLVILKIPPSTDIIGNYEDGCALTKTGDVWCWSVVHRRHHNTGKAPALSTLKLDAVAGVVEIVDGFDLRCARTKRGRLYCWRESILGNSFTIIASDETNIVDIDLDSNLCIVKQNGELACGDPSRKDQLSFDAINEISDAVEVMVIGRDQCVRTDTGTVRCIGPSYPGPNYFRVVEVEGALGVERLEKTGPLPCAITSSRQRLCWRPTTTETPRAIRVAELENAQMVAGRCAIDNVGKVFCWVGRYSCMMGEPLHKIDATGRSVRE
jgi:hypothetical protein